MSATEAGSTLAAPSRLDHRVVQRSTET